MDQHNFLSFTTCSGGRTIHIKASHIIGVSASPQFPAEEATLLLSNGTSINIVTNTPNQDRALSERIVLSLTSLLPDPEFT